MIRNLTKMIFGLALTVLSVTAYAQTTISGNVTDSEGEPLIGVNVLVEGTVLGTITDINGDFSLAVQASPPINIVISYVGYERQQLEVNSDMSGIKIVLEESTMLGQEVVVSASRVEEGILESPVSIEKMNIRDIQNTSSDDYYKSIANLKGVDMTTSSVNFQIINARGFNSTGNTRFVQLIDGMDTQAPALNFPIGNLNGPSAIDVESVELIPGAASALYGPNAFNGILLINSKSPFDYQGLSAYAKVGVNHIADSELNTEGQEIGPGSAQMMNEFSVRYAKAYNNKFAFKINASYSRAEDWYGTDLRDKSSAIQPAGLSHNPGSNLVHGYGDEVSAAMSLVKISAASSFEGTALEPFLNYFPTEVVSRTPYEERFLVDYGAKNIKFNTGLHYRLNDNLEISYTLNYGAGTTVYTGAQRYSLKNFNIQSHKLELKADNFFVRGYTTIENSGDSYIADLSGVLINRAWKGDSQWFGEYAQGYLTSLATFAGAGQFDFTNGPTAAQRDAAHLNGRATADVGRLIPGTPEFEAALQESTQSVIPGGSKFNDKSKFYHFEGMYDLKNQIDFMDLQVGASYKLYDLGSNGTIFADSVGNDITIQEFGGFAQASKRLLDDKLKLTGSVRYDKNENFDGQYNPRISGVYKVANDHNIRASFQTGFRNPTTQGQHIDLNVVTARLLGGLPRYAEAYNIYENAYTAQSVQEFIGLVASDPDPALALANPAYLDVLVAATELEPVKPEQVKSIEIGYKGLIGNKLFVDMAYYRNIYSDFIAQVQIRKAAGTLDLDATVPTEQNLRNAQGLLTPTSEPENTFQTYTNVNREVSAQGFVFGLEYILGNGYRLGANYNWNKLNEELGSGFLNEFNTPENKVNFTIANSKLTDKLGFNVAYRWQQDFRWESSFGQGDMPSVSTVDAQVSYKLSDLKSILKVGGTNILNQDYTLSYGGPSLGSIFYVSITFDEFLN
ncbi:MAG: TonB-dependent receptor [Ekhidna sp.]